MSDRICACGCGTTLKPYNGTMPLVCYGAWRRAPSWAKSILTLSIDSPERRRAAARSVLRSLRAPASAADGEPKSARNVESPAPATQQEAAR